MLFFVFKQKTAYEMRISDWSSDVCSSDLEFTSEIYVLSKDEGGRHTPFFANYRPQFYFHTTDVTGEVVLPEGTEMVMPGDNVQLSVKQIGRASSRERVCQYV